MTTETKELFNTLLQLEREILLLQEQVKEVKTDATFHKDDNPSGMDKEDVGNIAKGAKAKAKSEDMLLKIEALQLIEQIIADNE